VRRFKRVVAEAPSGHVVIRAICVERNEEVAWARIQRDDPVWRSMMARLVSVTDHYALGPSLRFAVV
jgi:hypothetical protein